MKSIKAVFLLGVLLLISACATVYTNENFADYQSAHKTVAILPYNVEIQMKQLPEGITSDDVSRMEEEEAFLFQQQVYSQFLNRYQKGEYTISFQDVEKTNILLERADINYSNLNSFTKEEIGQKLGVDAVISGDIKRAKPMGTGAAVVTTLLFGVGTTNSVDVNMRIHGVDSGDLVWSYDHTANGGIGSSPESLAKALMKNVSKKFPYKKEK